MSALAPSRFDRDSRRADGGSFTPGTFDENVLGQRGDAPFVALEHSDDDVDCGAANRLSVLDNVRPMRLFRRAVRMNKADLAGNAQTHVAQINVSDAQSGAHTEPMTGNKYFRVYRP